MTTDAAGTLVTGITGIRNGVNITSLLPAGGYAFNDNGFNPSGNPAFLTFNGVSYEVLGVDKYNFFYDFDNTAGGGIGYFDFIGTGTPTAVTATFTPVPEPSMVFGFVALGIGVGLKRKLG